MRYLSPQAFFLLAAAALLLVGSGLWWASRLLSRRAEGNREPTLAPRRALVAPAPSPLVAPEQGGPAAVAERSTAPPQEAAKILRRSRGFPLAGSGAHTTVHTQQHRPRPLA